MVGYLLVVGCSLAVAAAGGALKGAHARAFCGACHMAAGDITCWQPAHLNTAASQLAASRGVCAMLQAITPGAAATRSSE